MRIGISELKTLLLGQLNQLGSDCSGHLTALTKNHTPDGIVHHHVTTLTLLHGEEVHQSDILSVLREWCYQWGITYLWPYVLNLVEQLNQHIVHSECVLTLLLAFLINHLLDRTKIGHHRSHHTTRQTATKQQ